MLLHPWDFPGKSTGVGCHFLLQSVFLTQGLNLGLLHFRWIIYHLNYQGYNYCCQMASWLASILGRWKPKEWVCAAGQENLMPRMLSSDFAGRISFHPFYFSWCLASLIDKASRILSKFVSARTLSCISWREAATRNDGGMSKKSSHWFLEMSLCYRGTQEGHRIVPTPYIKPCRETILVSSSQ